MINHAVTFGVEEEFLLVDPETHLVVPRANEVLAEIRSDLRGHVKQELLATQIEISTPVCTSLGQMRETLTVLRSAAAAAAARVNCQLLPAGTGPLDAAKPPVIADNARFSDQARDLAALVDLPGVCACHVHVGVRDRQTATAVSNHLRPWLPALQALGTNSPFAGSRDTGYASWRSMLAIRYPTGGPPPWLESAAHHDEIVRQLISSGAIADSRAVYWYARPSSAYPTIEVRIADVCPSVDDTLLLAALIRALVATAVAEVDAGRPGPPVEHAVLVAAHWRAARFGLVGDGVDVLAANLRPAWNLVESLINVVGPALLALGDTEAVHALCDSVRANGSGAARQRAVYRASGDLRTVVEYLIAQAADPVIRPVEPVVT